MNLVFGTSPSADAEDAHQTGRPLIVRLPRPKMESNLKPSYLFESSERVSNDRQKGQFAGAFSPHK